MGFNSLSPFSCPSCLLSAAGGKASLRTARVGLSIPPAKTWALCWVSPSQVCPSGTPHPSALPTERAASSPRIPPPRRVSVSNWGSALRHGATPGSAGAGIRAGIAVLKAGEAPHSPGDPPPGRGRPAVGSDGRRHQRAVRDGAADGGQRPRGAAVRSPTLLGGPSHAGTRRDSALEAVGKHAFGRCAFPQPARLIALLRRSPQTSPVSSGIAQKHRRSHRTAPHRSPQPPPSPPPPPPPGAAPLPALRFPFRRSVSLRGGARGGAAL